MGALRGGGAGVRCDGDNAWDVAHGCGTWDIGAVRIVALRATNSRVVGVTNDLIAIMLLNGLVFNGMPRMSQISYQNCNYLLLHFLSIENSCVKCNWTLLRGCRFAKSKPHSVTL
jgi:hypothetical protein